jgi:hypothetical protein
VRNNCGITETDSPEAMAEKVRFALQEVGMEVEASAPYLLQLLGVQEGTEAIAAFTPEAIKVRTLPPAVTPYMLRQVMRLRHSLRNGLPSALRNSPITSL